MDDNVNEHSYSNSMTESKKRPHPGTSNLRFPENHSPHAWTNGSKHPRIDSDAPPRDHSNNPGHGVIDLTEEGDSGDEMESLKYTIPPLYVPSRSHSSPPFRDHPTVPSIPIHLLQHSRSNGFPQVPSKDISSNQFSAGHHSLPQSPVINNTPMDIDRNGTESVESEADPGLKELIERVYDDMQGYLESIPLAPQPPTLKTALLPHQCQALHWLCAQERKENLRGGILADDMGVGKTIETLSLMCAKPVANMLVVAPVTTLTHWKTEIEKHIHPDVFSVALYYGTKRLQFLEEMQRYNIILTSYGTLSAEYKTWMKHGNTIWLTPEEHGASGLIPRIGMRKKSITQSTLLFQMTWGRVVLDEAHYIKNRYSIAAKACYALSSNFRLCLSGTPVQNSLDDLYSLLVFLKFPDFPQYAHWREAIMRPVRQNQQKGYERLANLTKRILLRRRKNQLLRGKPIVELPEVTKNLIELEFSPDDRKFYDSIESKLSSIFNKLAAKGQSYVMKNYSTILVLLLRLRQAACHPYLIAMAHMEEDVVQNRKWNLEDLEYWLQDFLAVVDSEKEEYGDKQEACPAVDWDGEHSPRAQPIPSVFQKPTSSLLAFLENDAHICPICQDSAEDAMIGPCGHVFCESCIIDRLEEIPTCSVCNKALTIQMMTPFRPQDNRLAFRDVTDPLSATSNNVDVDTNSNDEDLSAPTIFRTSSQIEKDLKSNIKAENQPSTPQRAASPISTTSVHAMPSAATGHLSPSTSTFISKARVKGAKWTPNISLIQQESSRIPLQSNDDVFNKIVPTTIRVPKSEMKKLKEEAGSSEESGDRLSLEEPSEDESVGSYDSINDFVVPNESMIQVSQDEVSSDNVRGSGSSSDEFFDASDGADEQRASDRIPSNPIKHKAIPAPDPLNVEDITVAKLSPLLEPVPVSPFAKQSNVIDLSCESDDETSISISADPTARKNTNHSRNSTSSVEILEAIPPKLLTPVSQLPISSVSAIKSQPMRTSMTKIEDDPEESIHDKQWATADLHSAAAKAKVKRNPKPKIAFENQELRRYSIKLQSLLNALQIIKDSGSTDKVVVYSQFTRYLDLIQIPLRTWGWYMRRLDGSMNHSTRASVLHDFDYNPSVRILIISLKGGGVGINLTVANHIFLMDPWWNSAVENQAVDRVHRIGQKKPIFVTRFVVGRTVETRILEIQSRKDKVTDRALSNRRADAPSASGLTFDQLVYIFNARFQPDQETESRLPGIVRQTSITSRTFLDYASSSSVPRLLPNGLIPHNNNHDASSSSVPTADEQPELHIPLPVSAQVSTNGNDTIELD